MCLSMFSLVILRLCNRIPTHYRQPNTDSGQINRDNNKNVHTACEWITTINHHTQFGTHCGMWMAEWNSYKTINIQRTANKSTIKWMKNENKWNLIEEILIVSWWFIILWQALIPVAEKMDPLYTKQIIICFLWSRWCKLIEGKIKRIYGNSLLEFIGYIRPNWCLIWYLLPALVGLDDLLEIYYPLGLVCLFYLRYSNRSFIIHPAQTV